MAKRLASYRVDGDLLKAVAVKAAAAGDTVTDVITRAFQAYARDVAPPPAEPAPASEKPPEASPFIRRRCPHPGKRVIGGWCTPCNHMTEPGGYWQE